MKAWQRQIRERIAASGGDLTGRWWEGIDVDISSSVVRPVPFRVAELVISEYEWLGTMPAMSLYYYGIFFGSVCGGVVVYAPEYGENLGVWDGHGYTGKIICLARGACAHWAHPHAGSRLIRRSMELLPTRYEVITATTDHRAGEIGTIYQACGFHFVGAMSKRQREYIVLGKRLSERIFLKRQKQSRYSEGQFQVNVVPGKCRYFAFRGDKRAQRKHLAAIAHLIKPYPKRDIPKVDAGPTPEARFDPAIPLQT